MILFNFLKVKSVAIANVLDESHNIFFDRYKLKRFFLRLTVYKKIKI
jgi:hypothetical protein